LPGPIYSHQDGSDEDEDGDDAAHPGGFFVVVIVTIRAVIVTTAWKAIAHGEIENCQHQQGQTADQGLFTKDARGGKKIDHLPAGYKIRQHCAPQYEDSDFQLEEEATFSLCVGDFGLVTAHSTARHVRDRGNERNQVSLSFTQWK
jgi:hypothetical protein